MTNSLDKPDYVDLWKYFEGRGAELKTAMFEVVTWALGFAAVVFSFIVTQCLALQGDALQVRQPITLILLSIVGLGIVTYADFLLRDYGEHINRNFDRADLARAGTHSLNEIWRAEPKNKALPAPCVNIRYMEWFFGIAFGIGILLGLGTIVSRM